MDGLRIFQDPYSSLSPTMTVRQMLDEALVVHRIVPQEVRRARVAELLDRVGLAPEFADRRPHQFNAAALARTTAPWTPWLRFTSTPIVPIEESAAIAGEGVQFRDSVA